MKKLEDFASVFGNYFLSQLYISFFIQLPGGHLHFLWGLLLCPWLRFMSDIYILLILRFIYIFKILRFLLYTFYKQLRLGFILNPSLPNAPFLYSLKTSKKPYDFLIFSRGRESVHWELYSGLKVLRLSIFSLALCLRLKQV